MAQIKRKKVNTGKTGGGSRRRFSKKFWILLSTGITVVVAALVVAIIIINMNTSKKSKKNEIQDYFGGEATNLSYKYSDTEVSFKKISLDGLKMHMYTQDDGDEFVDYIFYLALDFNQFYPDKAINDGLSKDDKDYKKKDDIDTCLEIFDHLVQLQYYVDLYNAANPEKRTELYILNSGKDSGVLADTDLGGSEQAASSTLFGVVVDGKLLKEYKVNEDDEEAIELFTTDRSFVVEKISSCVTFMNRDNFVDNSKK